METLPLALIVIGVLVVGLLVGGLVAKIRNIEFRPFRTSAIFLSLILMGTLWLIMAYDITGGIEDDYSRGWIDASIIMVVLTGLVTSITKLTDDGGESDAIKMAKMFIDKPSNEKE